VALEKQVSESYTSQGCVVLRSGWPDLLVIPADGRSPFAVEVKAKRDRVKKNQKRMHEALRLAGIEVIISQNWAAGRPPRSPRVTR
jgi:hypothetical protein